MKNAYVTIIPFQPHHQAGVDELMKAIASEFEEEIHGPRSPTITEVSSLPGNRYWVAFQDEKVIGTIGFAMMEDNIMVLKRMFLDKALRGRGVAAQLLDKVIEAAVNNKVSCIFLGTMTQFEAAQKFYEKHGFVRIPQESLPAGFPANPVDKVFYCRAIVK